MRRPASVALLVGLWALACQSLVGFEDGYRLAASDASSGGTSSDAEADQIAADSAPDSAGDADLPIDLDSACEAYSVALCKSVPLCCQQYFGGFDEKICLAEMNEQCAKIASGAVKGVIKFDPTYLDECLAGRPANGTQCSLSVEGLFAALDALSPCRRLFAGTGTLGDACTDTFECADSFAAGASVVCDSSKKCVRYQVLKQGAQCTTAFYPAITCEDGTYCSKVDGSLGVCLAEVPLGQPCTFHECGVGNRCAANQCELGLAVGEICTSSLECASGLCACAAATCLTAEQKKCREIPTVDKQYCVAG